jgi:ribosomal protein S18 acetylase RimI-like enzyme
VAESADRPRVRRAARADADAVATLMYESSSGIYDRYAGGRRPALRVLRAAFRRRQTTASAEVVTVAELDGRVVGMIAAFPVEDASARAARFLRLTLARLPPWRWRETVRVFRLGASAAAPPPPGAVYVDALATTPRARRRGVATALVEATVREARLAGREWLALETETTNEAARALYRGLGFEETESRPPRDLMPGFVSYVKELRPASSLRP